MHLPRAFILIIAVLAQALPVSWSAEGEGESVCAMSCCAAAAQTCSCVKSPETPALPSPARTPPATGREIVPAVMWVASSPFLPLETFTDETKTRFYERRADTQPHVRLPVLFCSFLI